MIDGVELKTCPFCGGSAELKQKGPRGYLIRCSKCHIGLSQKVLRYSLQWLRETLIKNWNERV